MKLLHCLALIICLSCSGTSNIEPQDEQRLPDDIEALERLSSSKIDDSRKLEIYAKLGKMLKNSDAEKAKQYLEKQLNLAQEIDNKEYEGRAYHGNGLIYRREGKFVDAINSYLHAIDLFEETQSFSRLADDLNNIGFLFEKAGAYEEAITYFEKAFKYYKDTEDLKYLIITYQNLAFCNSKKGNPNFELAQTLYEEAIELQLEFDPNNNYQLVQLYNQLGGLNFKKGNFEEAIVKYKEAVEFANRLQKANEQKSNLYHNIAESYMYMGNSFYSLANDWITQAVSLSNSETPDVLLNQRRLNIAGELQQRQGNHAKAISLFEQAIDMADKNNYNEPLKNTLNLISQSQQAVVRKGGKIAYEQIFAIEELEDRQEELRIKFDDSLDKQALKEALKKEVDAYHAKVKQARIDSDNWVIIKSVGAFFLILLVALVALYRVVQKQKKELMINEGEREVILQVFRNT